jgi:hypothetical protein
VRSLPRASRSAGPFRSSRRRYRSRSTRPDRQDLVGTRKYGIVSPRASRGRAGGVLAHAQARCRKSPRSTRGVDRGEQRPARDRASRFKTHPRAMAWATSRVEARDLRRVFRSASDERGAAFRGRAPAQQWTLAVSSSRRRRRNQPAKRTSGRGAEYGRESEPLPVTRSWRAMWVAGAGRRKEEGEEKDAGGEPRPKWDPTRRWPADLPRALAIASVPAGKNCVRQPEAEIRGRPAREEKRKK